MTRRLRWSIALTSAGLLAAVVAFAATGSWGWALGALLTTGVVANSIASHHGAARTPRRNRR